MTENLFTVDADWLAARLGDSDLSIVDASWYLPTMLVDGQPRDGKAEFDAQHIPGAVYFDINAITEPASTLPHTLAPANVFAEKVGALGISDQDTIVVYDGMGLFSAARVWWNFRQMGARNVFVLDGGLPAWLDKGFEVESGSPTVSAKTFNAQSNASAIASLDDMQQWVKDQSMQIADARPHDRFTGEAPEPRAGMRSGHMPGAHSVPFSLLAEKGRLRSADQLRAAFEQAGIDLSKPVVTTCGSGVTAAALSLALETLGHSDHKLYDGSWSEWGGREDTQVVKKD